MCERFLKYQPYNSEILSIDFDSILNDGTQLVRMGNVKKGFFDFENKVVFLPNSFAEQYSRFLLSKGDLIISMTGTTEKEDYGNVCKVSVDKSFLLN